MSFLTSYFLGPAMIIGAILGIIAFAQNSKLFKRLSVLERELKALKAVQSASIPEENETEHFEPRAPSDLSEGEAETKGSSNSSTLATDDASAISEDTQEPALTSDTNEQPSSPSPTTSGTSFEDKIGSRWSVWVGGIALVLGGIFLVHYSIESGLLGPVQRVTIASLFALSLFVAAETLRRRPDFAALGNLAQSTYIPGILTLAGTTTAFAAIYSSHVLYGLIGPGTAFTLMAIIAVATLALSLLQGPILASTGLLASYVVPFLIESSDPAPWVLTFYGLAISLGSFGISRLRRWLWFANLTVIAGFIWGHLVAFAAPLQIAAPLAVYDVSLLIASIMTFALGVFDRNSSVPTAPINWDTSFYVGLNSWLVVYLLHQSNYDVTVTTTLLIVIALLMATAYSWPRIGPVSLAAPILALVGYLSWDVRIPVNALLFDQPIITDAIDKLTLLPDTRSFILTGLLLGLLMGLGGFIGAYLSTARRFLAICGVVGPIGIFFIALWRSEALEVRQFFGATALAMAAAYLCALAFLDRHLTTEDYDRKPTLATYTIATIGLIATAIIILLGDGWMQLALSALCASTIWVSGRWPLPSLGTCALALAGLVLLSIAWTPTIVPTNELSTTPLFNELLWGYGGPALIFWWCVFKLRSVFHAASEETKPRIRRQTLAFEALAIATSLATGAVLLHHATNNGLFYSPPNTLMEWSLHSLLALAASFGFQRLGRANASPVIGKCVLGLRVLSFAMIGILNLLVYNPVFTDEFIGENIFFNLLLSGYLLPAILIGFLASRRDVDLPRYYQTCAASLSILLAFSWVSLEIRQLYHSGYIGIYREWTNAELYSYSAAWLAFGVALLAYGVWRKAYYARISSAALVFLATAKAFLFDMSALEGIWRALSFIGLGIVLVSVGLLYQRILGKSRDSKKR